MRRDAIIRDWSGPEVASRGDSLYLFVHILQLEVEQFSPDDPLFGRLSKTWILPVVTN